jgi:hypothetical protein
MSSSGTLVAQRTFGSSERGIHAMPHLGFSTTNDHALTMNYDAPRSFGTSITPAAQYDRTSVPDMPSAYLGKSMTVSQQVDEMTIFTDNFYTQILSPIQLTDQIYYNLSVMIYDQHLMTDVPHKGTSRILTSHSYSESGQLIRRGIALQMEQDFMLTPEGRAHYGFQLNQMANANLASMNIDIVYAMLDCWSTQGEREAQVGMKFATDIIARIEDDIIMWDIIKKQKNGILKLDTIVSDRMRSWNASGDTWLLCPNASAWTKLVPPENVDYFLAGPKPQRQYYPEMSVNSAMTLNGNLVLYCTLRSDILGYGTGRSLLTQHQEIGSYYTMFGKRPSASGSCAPDYCTAHRAIRVYEEPSNDWKLIDLRYALDRVHGVFDRNGDPFLPPVSKPGSFVGDRADDMFSYPDSDDFDASRDDGSGPRKPVSLFGHLAERHFGPSSVVELCSTVAAFMAKKGTDVRCMEKILTKGLALHRKIGEQPVNMKWFYDVLIEHALGALSADVAIPDGGMTDAGWAAVKDQLTTPSKRAAIPAPIIRGSSKFGLNLPRYDYASVAGPAPANASVTVAAFKAEVAAREATKTLPLGGSVTGALAGFGNWEGFLSLKAELDSGPGVQQGYTKHGYLMSDCETASEFVDLVRHICADAQFLFKNPIYLDRTRAPSTIEDPTIEHVVAGYVFGLETGLPVWMDATKVNSLNATAAAASTGSPDQLRRQGGRRDVRETAAAFLQTNDENNARVLADILQYVDDTMTDPSVAQRKAAIVKKLVFFFEAATGWFSNDLDAYTALVGTQSGKFFTRLFPFCNQSPDFVTYASNALRFIALDAIVSLILNNKSVKENEKPVALNMFLEELGKATNLADVLNGIADPSVVKANASARSAGLQEGNGFLTTLRDTMTRGPDWTPNADDFPSSPSEIFEHLARWLTTNIKPQAAVKSTLDAYRKRLDMALTSDADFAGTGTTRSPVLAMMGIKKTDDPADWVTSSAGRYPGGKARERFVGGSIAKDDPAGFLKRADAQKAAGPVTLAEGFFRTPLILSAKQVVGLKDVVERTSVDTDNLMNIRVSDPTNMERPTEPSAMKGLVKRIKDINEKRGYADPGKSGDFHAFKSEPFSLFYPENLHRRDAAFASMPRKMSNLRGLKRSRRTADDGTYGSEKRRRTGASGRRLDGDTDFEGDLDVESEEKLGVYGRGGGYASILRKGLGMKRADRGEDEGDYEDDDDGYEFDSMDVSSLSRQMGISDDLQGLITGNMIRMMVKVGESTNSPLLKALGKIYLTSRLDRRTLQGFLENDVLFPFGVLVVQPHRRYLMDAGIKMKRGAETMVTMMGHSTLNAQNTAVDKTHFAHFTSYFLPVVKRRENIFVAPNVFSSGVIGGSSFLAADPRTYNPKEGKTGGGDVFFLLVPYEENQYHHILDVTGRFNDVLRSNNFVDLDRASARHYSQNWRAVQTFGWGSDSFRLIDDGQTGDQDHPLKNTRVIQGQQFNYCKATGLYDEKITNKGHWGEEGPGSLASRQGQFSLPNPASDLFGRG